MSNHIFHLPDQALLAHYDFSGVSSTIVPDLSGNGYTGVIRGHDRGGASIAKASVFGRELYALHLTGGAEGGFLQLPDGILNRTEGVTVSFYCCLRPLTDFGVLFSFGSDRCLYLCAMPDPEKDASILLSPCATQGGHSQAANLDHWVCVTCGKWFHVAVTFDTQTPAKGILYLDGEPCGSFDQRRMNALSLKECDNCFFGSGVFSPHPVSACFADIRIFNHVLAEEARNLLFHIEPKTRLLMEADALSALFETPLETAPSLPRTGQFRSAISWKSLTPETVSDDGQPIRPPAGSPTSKGVLEAVFAFDSHTLSRRYSFFIPPMPKDDEIAAMDAGQVTIPFPGHIAGNLSLPESGPLGSRFAWKSTRPDFMDNRGTLLRRCETLTELVLVLTSSYGAASVTREFPLRILSSGYRGPHRRDYIPAALPPRRHPTPKAHPVPLTQVRLKEAGLFYDNQTRCANYLLLLDTDRMLYNFRKAFGVSTRGAEAPGGWEEPAGLLRGHSTGHFLSALAYAYASTGDSRFRKKADVIIQEFLRLQENSQGNPAAFRTACTPTNAGQSLWSREPYVWGKGFLSAYSPDQFALLEKFTPYATIWAPYYTLHKILAGLLDCHRLLGNAGALQCACGIADWVCARLSATTAAQRRQMWKMYIAGEYGGMNESLARLYTLTGREDYLKTAQLFDNPTLFDGLAQGRDTLSGIHANQHIPQIIGALEEYTSTGDIRYYQLAQNFWELTVNHYMYSIGGVGRGENFREPDFLAGNIEGDRNCETCATYNLLKLTGMLYAYAPDYSPYMDYYERALLNHIAASQNPRVTAHAHHGVTYMLPIGPGAQKSYSNDYEDFTCCHGTGMENHVRYGEHIYHHGTDESLYVNLFLPSLYDWKEKDVQIALEGEFPAECFRLILTTGKDRPVPLKIKIRIPDWCRDTFRIRVNGTLLPKPNPGDGYYTVERTFATGDQILVSTPYALHLCYTQDAFEGYPAASLMYGPMVMVALCDQTEWLTLNLPVRLEDAFEIRWESMPVLLYDDLKFIPSYAAHHAPYHTYFKINRV